MSHYFHSFQSSIENIEIPTQFDYPFFYEPKPIAVLACEELKHYLKNQTDFEHNFGLNPADGSTPIGKMFGVLVCKDQNGKLGYLAAVSGKLANTNQHHFFVPPVFDMLNQDGFFLAQEEHLNAINRRIEELESDSNYIQFKAEFIAFEAEAILLLQAEKKKLKDNKNDRKQQRVAILPQLSEEEAKAFEEDLIKQSLRDKHEFRVFSEKIEQKRIELKTQIEQFESQISALKEERRIKSNSLQNQLFDQYQFLNQAKVKKGLRAIFEHTAFQTPPAAAGECAAPKLLQYAFANDLTPICMAEFWWGDAPKSEIRKHEHYYPACTGKCEPILSHMLEGIAMEENPLIQQSNQGDLMEIIYQDEDFIIVNKPEDFLSVPGIEIQDSVYLRIKHQFPNATGPLIVHRLDMATSGLLVLALHKEAHKIIQQQFIKRKIEKRYIALLDGKVEADEGIIDLPLRGDLDDRPRQMVCYEHGKPARTKYKVIKKTDTQTLVQFYPITGRTHQLRMHASHPLGLNAPILGDDLYGTKSNRLHLHAEYLAFVHPRTKELVKFQVDANFNL